MTEEDQELDRLWRATFGEPMPIMGGGDIVRSILAEPAAGKPRLKRENPVIPPSPPPRRLSRTIS
jgi:hypothetical protein